jgi:hypothetical protein
MDVTIHLVGPPQFQQKSGVFVCLTPQAGSAQTIIVLPLNGGRTFGITASGCVCIPSPPNRQVGDTRLIGDPPFLFGQLFVPMSAVAVVMLPGERPFGRTSASAVFGHRALLISYTKGHKISATFAVQPGGAINQLIFFGAECDCAAITDNGRSQFHIFPGKSVVQRGNAPKTLYTFCHEFI